MASTSSPTTKRQRCLSTALPELGCETSEFLPERGMLLRHGTSLQLMSLVTAVLDESQEFGELDPSADWQKWSERRPEFSLYYAALVDPARDGADAVQCVLRAILDGFPEPKPPHRQRLVIDYVTTRQLARGKGHASVLIKFVRQASQIFGANTYVLATEDSCPFWMEQGFTLEQASGPEAVHPPLAPALAYQPSVELHPLANSRPSRPGRRAQGKPLNARLNIFNDTHLLRQQGDDADAGAEEDLELAQQEGEGAEEGEEEDGEGGEGDQEQEEIDDDAALQAALAASMLPAASAPPAPAHGARAATIDLTRDDDAPAPAGVAGDGEEEDEELKAALALSMAPP
jgi:GNAT superfamily N-acetyltransferase